MAQRVTVRVKRIGGSRGQAGRSIACLQAPQVFRDRKRNSGTHKLVGGIQTPTNSTDSSVGEFRHTQTRRSEQSAWAFALAYRKRSDGKRPATRRCFDRSGLTRITGAWSPSAELTSNSWRAALSGPGFEEVESAAPKCLRAKIGPDSSPLTKDRSVATTNPGRTARCINCRGDET